MKYWRTFRPSRKFAVMSHIDGPELLAFNNCATQNDRLARSRFAKSRFRCIQSRDRSLFGLERPRGSLVGTHLFGIGNMGAYLRGYLVFLRDRSNVFRPGSCGISLLLFFFGLLLCNKRTECALLGLLFQRIEPDGKRRSEEHTSELQSPLNLVCRLLLEKKKK